MDRVFADTPVMAAPYCLAVNSNDLTSAHAKDPFNPAHERYLKCLSIQQCEKAPKRVVRRDAMRQVKKGLQPFLLRFTEALHLYPTLRPRDDGAHRYHDDID